ncbi:MAG: hypothetical protein IJN53_06175, partial [Oscillospiraceae bacterium]|nr:hypothetical protein [Oscillospiraceae bacterium]
MKQALKRSLSILVALALVLSLAVAIAPQHVHAAPSFSSVGGWFESIYAEISGVKDSAVTGVSYSGTMSGQLSGDDLKYLVRDSGSGVRIDIPGLKPGSYTLTVTTSSGTITKSGISVLEYDRSGYAHFNYAEGVGAYNNDGTLKDNAIVLYVTDENKNSVTVTSKDGTTVTGIGNILGSTGQDVGGGKTTKGGKANSNQDIIRKLANDGTPLVVRLIGNVTAPEGVTAYDSTDYGGLVGDNGYMARMSGGKDITIEGIGAGTVIDGWGIHFICDTNDYANGIGRSFEIRNISFRNVPEDCVGMEGVQDSGVLVAPVERCWVHHCAFYGPNIANPAEADKSGGDGACDFKRGHYFTNSYCYYEGYHKTNLVGADNKNLQFHMTYHHNHWAYCESRGPLARQANIHMYNNLFEHQTSKAMDTRANAYIFSEHNVFFMTKNPGLAEGGAVIMSYNDTLASCIGDFMATVVTNKNQNVSNSCQFSDFVTNSSVSYIPSGNYDLQTDVEDTIRVIAAYTGPMKANVVTPETVEASLIPSEATVPSGYVSLPYSQSLNSSYLSANATKDNIVFNLTGFGADYLEMKGVGLVFKVNTTVNISMTDGGDDYPVTLLSQYGEVLISGTGTAKNVPAGTYFIMPGGFQATQLGQANIYKDARISALTIESTVTHGANDHVYKEVVTAPTCTEKGYTTYVCDCGESYTGNETPAAGHKPGAAATCVDPQLCAVCGEELAPANGHSYVNGVCSVCGVVDPSTCAHSDCEAVVTAPTCTEGGYTTFTCNDCGHVFTGNTVAAAGHTPGAEATCLAPQTCTVCSATLADALGHNYVDGVCTRCGRENPAANGCIHNFTDDGFTSDFYTFSGSQLTNGKHGKYTYDFGYGEETLTYALKLDSAGSVTFTPTENGTVTIALGTSSTNRKVGIFNSAGTEIGNIHVANTNTLYVLTVEVSANDTYTVKRTSNESGLYYIAFIPDESSSGDVHKHSYSEKITTAATCDKAGVKTFTCSCGASYTEAIPALGHSEVTVKGYAATCDTDGLTDGVSCSVCSAVITAQEAIPALGHDYVSSIKAPTCTESGLRTNTCNNCGDVTTEVIPASGHSYSNGSCTVCGAADPNYQAPDENIKNGLAKGDDGNYYYYINNEVQWDYTGLIANSAGNWYILNGQAQLSYDGLVTFEGTKYLIKAGHVNTAFTGITKQEG